MVVRRESAARGSGDLLDPAGGLRSGLAVLVRLAVDHLDPGWRDAAVPLGCSQGVCEMNLAALCIICGVVPVVVLLIVVVVGLIPSIRAAAAYHQEKL